MYDLIIRNGTVIDGTGDAGFPADVAVRDGRIAAVGQIAGGEGDVIDAAGKIVCPGFIDPHTHYDAQVFWDRTLSPSCYHGVTTAVGGYCGFSIAPLTPDAAGYLLPMLSRVEGMPVVSLKVGVPWDWSSFGDYLSKIDGKIGVNVGFMAGHSAIRRVVMGSRAVGHEATDDEIRQMTALLETCLKEGAMGFSSTISVTHNDADGNPVPSRFASRDEFLALAKVLADFPGTSLEFLPGVGVIEDEVADLMIAMSLAAKRPLNWNVLMVNVEKIAKSQLAVTDRARAAGAEVLALVNAGSTTMRINLHAGFLFDSLNGWDSFFRMPVVQRIEYLKSPENREKLERKAREDQSNAFSGALLNWDEYVVSAVYKPENKAYEGRRIGDIARELGKSPRDALFDLAVSEGLRTSFIPATASAEEAGPEAWELRRRAWLDDRTVLGASDAGAHLDMIDSFSLTTQILGHGVREHGLLSFEQAIHEFTQRPAQMLGVKDRGLIHEGLYADIVIFDPGTVACGEVYMRNDVPAGESRVYADAVGIDHVFVNGTQIIRDGEHTGELPGKVFRGGQDTVTPAMPIGARGAA